MHGDAEQSGSEQVAPFQPSAHVEQLPALVQVALQGGVGGCKQVPWFGALPHSRWVECSIVQARCHSHASATKQGNTHQLVSQAAQEALVSVVAQYVPAVQAGAQVGMVQVGAPTQPSPQVSQPAALVQVAQFGPHAAQ